jgi:dipeptide/tripeptide permease
MLTFEALATPGGVVVAAGIVTAIVQLLKSVFPGLSDRVNGLQQAFLLTAALYITGALVLSPLDANGYLGIFLAWLSCATSAVGIYEAAVKPVVAAMNKPAPPKVIGPHDKFSDP